MGLRVLAPTGSGKSTAAEAYIDHVERARPKSANFIPIVKVNLEKTATPKKLLTSILTEFGDPNASYGNELILKQRAMACFKRFKTELLIVDEVQHLNYRHGPKSDVTDTLKVMLDEGVVPMVFLGTEEASAMFSRNLQLNGRLLPPCDFEPLQVDVKEDRTIFAGFVSRLEKVLLDQKVFEEESNLASLGMLGPLFEVSQGVVGRVSRLFHHALDIGIRRGATRLEPYDLALAVDRWAISQDFIKHNPIRQALND